MFSIFVLYYCLDNFNNNENVLHWGIKSVLKIKYNKINIYISWVLSIFFWMSGQTFLFMEFAYHCYFIAYKT